MKWFALYSFGVAVAGLYLACWAGEVHAAAWWSLPTVIIGALVGVGGVFFAYAELVEGA